MALKIALHPLKTPCPQPHAHSVRHARFLPLLAGSLLIAGLSALPARAIPTSSVYTSAWINSSVAQPSPSQDIHFSPPGHNSATLSSQSFLEHYDFGGVVQAHALAYVQPGLFHLYADGGAGTVDYGPPSVVTQSAQATASARWEDYFVIDGGALNGSLGHLVAGLEVSGTWDYSYDASVMNGAWLSQSYQVVVTLDNYGGSNQTAAVTGGLQHYVDYQGAVLSAPPSHFSPWTIVQRAPGLWFVEIDFVIGTPIHLDMRGEVLATIDTYACGAGDSGPSWCVSNPSHGSILSATTDFGHTINWGGILSLTDANGNPIGNYTVTSDSGFDYRFPAVSPVPEPESWALLAAGLGLVGIAARRRGRQQRQSRIG